MARMGALLRLLISTSTSSEPVNKADFLPVALSTCTRDDAFFSCPTEIRGGRHLVCRVGRFVLPPKPHIDDPP